MAYPPLRSRTDSLNQGAYMDGQVKQLRPNATSAVMDASVNAAAKRSLNLPYYGFGQPRVVNIPGTNRTVPTLDFVPNKFEEAEDGPTFGKTW